MRETVDVIVDVDVDETVIVAVHVNGNAHVDVIEAVIDAFAVGAGR